jgi:mono/diheme cytochrome c family protein
MAFPIVSLTAAACLLMAACGGDRPAPPPSTDPPELAAAPPPPATTSSDPRAAIFVRKGCPQCHTISALGVKSPTELGPDLTYAYTDVQNRFSMKLEEFLKNPTGTMQVVLSSQIKLSPEERDSVIHILKGLHENAEDVAEPKKAD